MPEEIFYSPLSDLINFDQLPDSLSFIGEGLGDLLANVYFKNLYIVSPASSSPILIDIDIVSFSKILKLDIAGTGLILILNPDLDINLGSDANVTVLPLSISWKWELLDFISNFQRLNFSYSVEVFYGLIVDILQLDETNFLKIILNASLPDDSTEEEGAEDPGDGSGTTIIVDSPPIDPVPYSDYDPSNLSTYDPLIPVYDLDRFVTIAKSKFPQLVVSQPLNNDPTTALNDVLVAFQLADMDLYSSVFSLFINDTTQLENITPNFIHLFANFSKINVLNALSDFLIPSIQASALITAALDIPRNILVPLNTNDEIIAGDIKCRLLFDVGNFIFNSNTGFGFDDALTLSFSPTTPKAQIANTGLIIGFSYAKLDTSSSSNISEADAAGFPTDFKGLYVQHATIELGKKFGIEDSGIDSDGHTIQNAIITADNLLIGTGGISGIIRIDESGGIIHRRFGDFNVKLDEFTINFRQNTITNCDIKGQLSFSKIKAADGVSDAVIGIEVQIKDNGDFAITAKPQGDFAKIVWPQVFELQIRSLKLGEEGGDFYIEVAGVLNFIADIQFIGGALPENIEISKLRIWSDGRLEFVGGVLPVPKTFSFNIGPIKLEVDHLTISPYHRQHNGIEQNYLCVGFDGMVNTGRAGVNAAGNGIKYYFSIDGPFDQFFSIDGIVIDMTIPGNVPDDEAQFILHGLLNIQQPTADNSVVATQYTGAVSFTLPKLKLSGSAGMRLTPSIPSFVVDIDIELPMAIPLGAGLGIYGFRGLLGQHYMISKQAAGLTDDATWWDYYKAPDKKTKKVGIQIGKMADEPGFTVGAGATIGTAFDDGFTFSSKLFIMLGLPNFFLLQGQAGILRSRLALSDEADPPFSAQIMLDVKHSFQANVGVDYKIPDKTGLILSVSGDLDIYFAFNGATGWHINLGQDQPDSKRIQASILSVFQGYAYLMISSQGIKAGAGASFGFHLDAGIVGAGFDVSIDMKGQLSFTPFQIGASIVMRGSAYIKIWFLKLSLGIEIGLSVEAPHPFNMVGYLEISVHVLFKKFSGRLEIRLGHSNSSMTELLAPISLIGLPDPATGYSPAKATHMLTGESFQLNYVNNAGAGVIPPPEDPAWQYSFEFSVDQDHPDQLLNPVTIPLDSFIDIELLKPVQPGTMIGGYASQLPDGFSELLPPQKGVSDQVKHVYALNNVEVKIWKPAADGGQWVDYNIYLGIPAIVDTFEETGDVSLASLKPGYWQFTDKNKFNKIRLMSQDMFSYLGKISNTLPDLDALNFVPKDLFCYDHILNQTVVDWQSEVEGEIFPAGSSLFYDGIRILVTDLNVVTSLATTGSQPSLSLTGSYGSLLITLPEPVVYAELDFLKAAHGLSVTFSSTVRLPLFFNRSSSFAIARKTITAAAGQATTTIHYGETSGTIIPAPDEIEPIDQILITLDGRLPSDYDGNLIVGGHLRLDEQFGDSWLNPALRDLEMERALTGLALYSRTLTDPEIRTGTAIVGNGFITEWRLDTTTDAADYFNGWTTGSPGYLPDICLPSEGQPIQKLSIFSYTSVEDAVVIPPKPQLKVENGDFALEVTMIFDPFVTGVTTLLTKLTEDSRDSLRHGFALHLSQQAPPDRTTVYTESSGVPQYSVWLTCYAGEDSWGTMVTDAYTVACDTGMIEAKQYKHLAISVDRAAAEISLYLDRQLKSKVAIPAELGVFEAKTQVSFLDSLLYMTPGLRARTDLMPPEPQFINEEQILSNTLNQTIQPVWRPNAIFAIRVSASDTVSHSGHTENPAATVRTFGFRTAGPLGHFHQHSPVYAALEDADRAGEFKLASLKAYIDYNRSYPDALSRYGLSKPVFWQSPEIRLFFTESTLNAMFADWDDYLGLTPVTASLETLLIDPNQQMLSPHLVWHETTVLITADNYKTLPPSQQLIFLFNQAAAGANCNQIAPLTKKIRQGAYVFDALIPEKFYTAIFRSVYQPDGGDKQVTEVHRFTFQVSRYPDFAAQVNSLVLDPDAEVRQYALTPLSVSFTQSDIDNRLKLLIDGNSDNDPASTWQYAVPFERIVYGGLGLTHLEPAERTTVLPVINTDPGQPGTRRMLGLLIMGPEPFNDPKFDDKQRIGTVSLKLTDSDGQVYIGKDFLYFHSRDTSSVFVTNLEMDLPAGSAVLTFIQKVFNGQSYDHVCITTDALDLKSFFNS